MTTIWYDSIRRAKLGLQIFNVSSVKRWLSYITSWAYHIWRQKLKTKWNKKLNLKHKPLSMPLSTYLYFANRPYYCHFDCMTAPFIRRNGGYFYSCGTFCRNLVLWSVANKLCTKKVVRKTKEIVIRKSHPSKLCLSLLPIGLLWDVERVQSLKLKMLCLLTCSV